jgi:hypothetical protein
MYDKAHDLLLQSLWRAADRMTSRLVMRRGREGTGSIEVSVRHDSGESAANVACNDLVVIAGDKRNALAQGSVCDEAIQN